MGIGMSSHPDVGWIKTEKDGKCEGCREQNNLTYFRGIWLCSSCIIEDLINGNDKVDISDDLMNQIIMLEA